MPRPVTRRYPAKAPDKNAVLTALWAMAGDEASDARVAAFVERVGGVVPERDTTAHAKRGTGNEAAGRKYERLTAARLRADGYTVTKSQDSKGAGDLVAYGPKGTRVVQVKSVSDYRPSCANQGLRELLGLSTFKAVKVGPGITREVWCWMRGDDSGPLVVVRVDHHGDIEVSGEPAEEVVASITKMLARWQA